MSKKKNNLFTVSQYKNMIKKKRLTEEQEQRKLCKWVKANYPNVLYTIDLGGMSLTKTQRIVHNTRCKRGHPDMMFQEWYKDKYCGLAIEFKRTGEFVTYQRPLAKKGEFKTDDAHLMEQLNYIVSLKEREWLAGFVCGIDNAKKVITAYMEAGQNSLDIINKLIYPKIKVI